MGHYIVVPAILLQGINLITEGFQMMGVNKDNMIILLLFYVIYLLIKTIRKQK